MSQYRNRLTSTHCSLLPVISHCLPIFDDLCHRCPLKFVRSSITHDCPLIRFIASYGIVHASNCSPNGQIVLCCFKCYNCNYDNLLFGSVNSIVNSFYFKFIGDSTFSTANLLSELSCVRDGLCDIANNFTKEELLSIIDIVCTSWVVTSYVVCQRIFVNLLFLFDLFAECTSCTMFVINK